MRRLLALGVLSTLLGCGVKGPPLPPLPPQPIRKLAVADGGAR